MSSNYEHACPSCGSHNCGGGCVSAPVEDCRIFPGGVTDYTGMHPDLPQGKLVPVSDWPKCVACDEPNNSGTDYCYDCQGR